MALLFLTEVLHLHFPITSLNLNKQTRGFELKLPGQGVVESLHLIAKIVRNNSITSLQLMGNKIGDEGAAMIAEALRVNSSLTALNLASTGLGDEGAAGIASALYFNSSLSDLALERNNIGDEGAAMFATLLHVNSSLASLSLMNQRTLADEAAILRNQRPNLAEIPQAKEEGTPTRPRKEAVGKMNFTTDAAIWSTEEMRKSMMTVTSEADVINRLEQEAAEMFGKEASLFVSSSQGNLVALLVHVGEGEGAILGDISRCIRTEARAAAVIGRITPQTVAVQPDGRY